jgi:hypothetical protein
MHPHSAIIAFAATLLWTGVAAYDVEGRLMPRQGPSSTPCAQNYVCPTPVPYPGVPDTGTAPPADQCTHCGSSQGVPMLTVLNQSNVASDNRSAIQILRSVSTIAILELWSAVLQVVSRVSAGHKAWPTQTAPPCRGESVDWPCRGALPTQMQSRLNKSTSPDSQSKEETFRSRRRDNWRYWIRSLRRNGHRDVMRAGRTGHVGFQGPSRLVRGNAVVGH